MEDIRRYAEVMLRKYFIGNGVPDENSFKITAADTPANDFKIFTGRCLVEGFEVVNEPVNADGNPFDFILYSQQEDIVPLNVPEITEGKKEGDRLDTVYLDVWIEEVTGQQEAALNNPQDINVETCTRHKLNWRVKVNEGTRELPGEAFHHYYAVARISRKPGKETIEAADITDLRRTGMALYLIKAGLDLLTGQSNADAQHTHSQLVIPGSASVPALQVDNNGKVGIGITDPDPAIRLVVGGALYPAIRMTSTDGSTGFIQTLHEHGGVRLYDGKDYTMHWKDGKVGIGTTEPVAKLDVRWGNNEDWTAFLYNAGGDGKGLKIQAAAANETPVFQIEDNYGNVRFVAKSNGNVGIGVAKPIRKLEVNGNIWLDDIIETYHDSGHYGRIQLYNGQTGHMTLETCWESGNSDIILNPDHNVVINRGNVGIGVPEPGENLHVYRIVRIGDTQIYDNEINRYNNDNLYIGYRNTKDTILQANGGNVGIGSKSSSEKLSIDGNIDMTGENRRIYMGGPGGTTFGIAFSPYYCDYGIFYTEGSPDFVSISPNGNSKSGAMNVYGDGNVVVAGNIHAINLAAAGIDYAEYFESKDGKEIDPGTAVVLEMGRVRQAKKNETPLGIISATPSMAGGVHIEWPKKHLRDEFGRVITEEYKEEIMKPKKEKVKKERQKIAKKTVEEEVTRTEIVKIKGKYCQKEITETVEREIEELLFEEVDLYDAAGKNKIGKHRIPVMETYEEEIDVLDEKGQPVMVGTGKFETKTRPKINPDYDETKEYIPREKRPEWNCVGLLGQLPLRKGQPVAPTWIKIKDISKAVELWLVK
jgi:hypothetical protein